MNLTATLIALFGPFLLWPVELLLPFPYLVEEIFKFVVVLYILKSKESLNELYSVIVSGVLFSLSETVLYIFNINAYGEISLLFMRLLGTSLLHTSTFLIIYFANKKKPYMLLGGVAAIMIHYLYNVYI